MSSVYFLTSICCGIIELNLLKTKNTVMNYLQSDSRRLLLSKSKKLALFAGMSLAFISAMLVGAMTSFAEVLPVSGDAEIKTVRISRQSNATKIDVVYTSILSKESPRLRHAKARYVLHTIDPVDCQRPIVDPITVSRYPPGI